MAEDIVFVPAGEVIQVANPAAGTVPPVFTVGVQTPPNQRVQLLYVTFTLQSDATVGNRGVTLTGARAGVNYYRAQSQGLQAASITNNWMFAFFGLAAVIAPGGYFIPSAPLTMLPGDTLAWAVSALGVGDQFSNIAYTCALL